MTDDTTTSAARGSSLALPRWVRAVASTVVTLLLTFIGLTAVTFAIGRIMPADPVLAIIGDRASNEVYERVYKEMGLDRPIYEQYWRYLNELVSGDLGMSIMTARPVLTDIGIFFPATLELATIATLIGVLLGVPMGVIAAVIAPLEYLELRSTGAPVPMPRSRMHDRLDEDMGEDIVSLSMQDHYVEVTTGAGRQLILMRLSDAMEELHPIQGVQLHRSHWAATQHLKRLEKDGARHVVHLKDGRSLPVSGTYLDGVRNALSEAAQKK